MKKSILACIAVGIGTAILWSVVFVQVLGSMAGIGVGLCLGVSFGILGSLIFKGK